MTTFAELDRPTVVVVPGEEATITLTVRNDSDIVEAYEFEVLGECAPWTTVEPARLSLYPGTAENVTVLLRPPRSPDVPAGEKPLGVRVLPVERPATGTVSESTVILAPFSVTEPELVPRRRRAWRSARYSVTLKNLGNTSVTASLSAADTEQQLRFRQPEQTPEIAPGETEPTRMRARARKLIWFGKPVTRTFRVGIDPVPAQPVDPDVPERHELDGEFVQLPLLPRWLLALLAALLALLLAWFLLVRPAITSAATQAANDKAQQIAQAASAAATRQAAAGDGQPTSTSQPPDGGDTSSAAPPPAGTGLQSSATIQVRVNAGGSGTSSYVVPDGKVFRITDILLANPQGDEGLLTVVFGPQTITRIALETFRNQDYHWVTPIDVPAGRTVDATVACARPGTPASGVAAPNCLELLNVSGELVDEPR